jgi:choline monooxygenase
VTSIRQRLALLSQPTAADNALALDSQAYVADEIQDIEKQAIFRNSWQYACHASEVRELCKVHIFEIAGIPLVVVRGQDNHLRAFYNVCQHRAGPVACDNTTVTHLRCAYHGWTYDLTGQLLVAPEMESTAGFNACDVHLKSVHCCEWQGMVFVHLGESPGAIEEFFAGIIERIKPIDLGRMSFHHRETYEVQCHWKVYMDNYLEGYHLPYVHPSLSKLLDYRAYDTELFDWYSLQSSPLQDDDGIYGEGEAFYYCAYPNLMLNILPGRCQLNQVLPNGSDRCLVHFDYFYADLESATTQSMIQRDLEFSDEIQQEDIDICEQVQKGLSSGAYQAGRLCHKREQGVWHFQEMIRAAYRDWLSRTA